VKGIRYCLDGRWLTGGESAFAPTSGVLASGEGWFETIRVESGRPMFETAHLDRLCASITRSFGREHGSREATQARAAAERCLAAMSSSFSQFPSGRVRLLLSRDDTRELPNVGGWQALGEWSEHRSSAGSLESGIDVVIASFPHPGLGFLGKSASYHWSLAARREAQARGASEALLVRDGHLLEGATGAIAWQSAGRWFVHESPATLASVTVDALRRSGVALEHGNLPVERLDPSATTPVEGMILISALRLAVSIRECEGKPLPAAAKTATTWREALLALHARENS